MRICFWVSHVATVGGVQRVTVLLANALSGMHEVTVVTCDTEEQLKKNIFGLKDTVRVIRQPENLCALPLANRIGKRLNKLTGAGNHERTAAILERIYIPGEMKNRLKAFWNGQDFDWIIGVQGDRALLLASVSRELSAGTVGWQHSSFEGYFRNRNRHFWNQDVLFRKYLPELGHYVVLNEADREKTDQAFRTASAVIPNPKSFVSAGKCDPGKPCFLAAGRFVRAKGFDLLAEAFALFAEKNGEWNCLLAGDGEERRKTERKIRSLGLENRILLTGCAEDIREVFRQASVLLLPSRWEGMPMIVLEALEMGCPVVAFDLEAVKALITDGREGLLVPAGRGAAGFAEAMEKIAGNAGLRRRMQQQALRRSKAFAPDRILPLWEALFQSGRTGRKPEETACRPQEQKIH